MDIDELGEKLLGLCDSNKNNYAEIKELLESLSEEQRREVVRYDERWVSESWAEKRFAKEFASVTACLNATVYIWFTNFPLNDLMNVDGSYLFIL